jgi:hypothetical protein
LSAPARRILVALAASRADREGNADGDTNADADQVVLQGDANGGTDADT